MKYLIANSAAHPEIAKDLIENVKILELISQKNDVFHFK
jgi:hypothetical protein